MSRYLVRRAFFSLDLMAVVSSAALLLRRLAPGDVTTQLGPLPAPAEVARERARFDLDRGMAQQWVLWQVIGEAFGQPHITAAIARGVPRPRLLLRHAWHPSLRSVCAVYGVAAGSLLPGSFIVEYITAWPGLGRLMYEALRARDIYLVAGCAALGAACLAAGVLLGDLLLATADPRIRDGQP